MDRDKARVFAYLTKSNSWVPIIWLNRFGHYVSFQWQSATASDGTVVFSVLAKNQIGLGVQAQWGQSSVSGKTTVFRADYIGFQAPSIQIQGYSGIASDQANLGGTPSRTLVSYSTPVFRPTLVTEDNPANLSTPTWITAGIPVPSATGNDPWAQARTWGFTYNALNTELSTFTSPKGISTTFGFQTISVFSDTASSAQVANNNVRAVISSASSEPASGCVLSKKWTRVLPVLSGGNWTQTSWVTTLTQSYSTGDSVAIPSEEWTFPVPNSIGYGNGVPIQYRLFTAGKTWKEIQYLYTVAGWDQSLNPVCGILTTEDGHAPSSLVITTDSVTGIPDSETLAVNGQIWQKKSYTYDTNLGLLNQGRPTAVASQALVGSSLVNAPTHVMTYNSNGELYQDYMDAGGGLQRGRQFGYDGGGHRNAEGSFSAGANGNASNATSYIIGANGLPSSATITFSSPNGGSTSYSTGWSYNAGCRILTATDGSGLTTTMSYDSRGRVLSKVTPGNPTLKYTYTSELFSNWSSSDGQSGSSTVNGFNQVTKIVRADGIIEVPSYDILGRQDGFTQYLSTGVSRNGSATLDPLGRVISTSRYDNPISKSLTYTSSGSNSIVVTTLSNGLTSTVVTDPLGRVVELQGPLTTVSTTFNAMGKPTMVQETAGAATQVRSYTYDGLGNLISRVEPETGTSTYSSYDGLGNPQSIVDAVRSLSLTYDGLGRTRSVSGGSESAGFVYNGLLLGSTSSSSGGTTVNQSFSYDQITRKQISETTTLPGSSWSTYYGYDTYGRLSSLTYPSGRTISYGYDNLSRVNSVLNNNFNLVKQVVFDPNQWENFTSLTFASGAADSYSWQTPGGSKISNWSIAPIGSSATNMPYGYDSNGYPNSGAGWSNLTHDAMGRLQSATGFGIADSYGLDGFCNNLTHSVSPVPLGWNNFSFGAMPNNLVPSLEANGAITGWTTAANSEPGAIGTATSAPNEMGLNWDGLGRMSTATIGGNSWTNVYNARGLRVQLIDSSNSANNRRYVYVSNGNLLGEYVGSGTSWSWRRDVIYLGSMAIAEIDGNGVHELHCDQLGSPRLITAGSSGAQEGQQVFGPYGELIPAFTNGYSPLIGFTGHLHQDPSGLIYMRGRFYVPAWHRFLNSDKGADSSSSNQCSYVGGSPFLRADPWGISQVRPHLGPTFMAVNYLNLYQMEGDIVNQDGSITEDGSDTTPQETSDFIALSPINWDLSGIPSSWTPPTDDDDDSINPETEYIADGVNSVTTTSGLIFIKIDNTLSGLISNVLFGASAATAMVAPPVSVGLGAAGAIVGAATAGGNGITIVTPVVPLPFIPPVVLPGQSNPFK